MVTLMIIIDGLSIAYVSKEYMPFVHSIAQDGFITTIKPLFAFRGIETTIFTGQYPIQHGVWTEICLRSNGRKSKKMGHIVKLADLVNNDKLRKVARVLPQILLYGYTTRLTPNIIPSEIMHYFEPSQKRAIYEQNALDSSQTLFDLLRIANQRFAVIQPSFLFGDKGIISSVKKLVTQHIDFWFLKFNKLDKDGHINGPYPERFQQSIREVDRYVRKVTDTIKNGSDEINVIIFGDHGMSKVENYTNLLHELKALKPCLYKDYIVFLDSTIARFWFTNGSAKKYVTEFLNSKQFGHIISEKEITDLRIPKEYRYGEVVFALDEGSCIYPDFWSGKRLPKGMHGYAYTKSYEALPALAANKNMKEFAPKMTSVEFIDIMPWVLNSLNANKQ